MFPVIFHSSPPRRPAASSPLAPVSPSSPSRSRRHRRQLLSSPTRGTGKENQPFPFQLGPPHGHQSRFATRPGKMPLIARSREQIQEERRRLFLQGAKQRSEDRAWQRRDIEGYAVRRWFDEHQDRIRATAQEAITLEPDLEDAAMWPDSELMVDHVARQEEMELDAAFAAFEGDNLAEDEDLDRLLVDLVDGVERERGLEQERGREQSWRGPGDPERDAVGMDMS